MAKLKRTGKPLDFRMREMWARGGLSRGLLHAAGALGAFTPVLALANPTGGQVVAGSATIGTAGSNGVVVNQNSQRAAINWQQFSIGSNEYVQFNQPNSSSVVLNRVTGNNPSSIFGSIRANGQVFLINPNGILFAPGSTLDVSSLTASTLDISNSNFMARRYVFAKDPGAPDATVVNQGSINVTAGGYVVLSGDYVENDGVIQAQSGKVLLAAGGGTTLTLDNSGGLISYKIDAPTLARLAGVDNTGSIAALGGTVVMTADVANALTATAVNNSGLITAHSVRQQGGEIVLLSQGGGIENSGTLDASATQNGVEGGTVVLRGNKHTQLTDTSVIDTSGDGAQGGFIELSGHALRVRGQVTAGKGGNLLLDPAKINIVSGPGLSSPSMGTGSIGTGFIDSKLDAGSNVTILASNQIKNTTGTGIAATGTGNLTIVTGAGGGASCGIGGICVGHGSASVGHLQGSVDLTGLPINIAGKLSIDAAGNADSGGHIKTAGLKGSSVFVTATDITVTGNIVATGGDITLYGHSGNTDTMTVTGNITANNGGFKASFSNEGGAGIGNVHLNNVTAQGITIIASHINVTGSLHAKGSGEAAGSHRDIVLLSQHEFSSAGGAGINVGGDVISDHGSVNITASGRTIAGVANAVGVINVAGSISAARNVNMSASNSGGFHNYIKTGAITAGGAVTINYQGGGAGASNSTGATVKVGNVDSQREMSFSVNDSSNTGSLVVKTGTLTNHKGSTSNGNGIDINLSGANPHFQTAGISNLAKSGQSCECGAGDIRVNLETTNGSHAQLKVTGTGAVKSTHGNVSFGTSDTAIGSIAVHDVSGQNVVMYGRTIGFGNITAANNVRIIDDTTANGAGITATHGTTISARSIDIDLDASYGGAISLANLDAHNSTGPAEITVTAQSFNDSVSIVVNGNINVSGKGATAGFSSGMPGLGVPMAASLTLQAIGSNESGPAVAHTVKVTGNITMTGVGGAFNFSRAACGSGCETGHHPGFHATGKGAMVALDATAEGSLGSVQLLGTTTLKGTDAELQVSANAIKTGALNVTGSGHNMTLTTNGSSGSGASKNSAGRANIFLQNGPNTDSSAAATITVGNVTVNGKGSATVMMDGKHVTAGDIKVTATAAKGSRSGSLFNDGLGRFVPGLLGFPLDSGAYNAGHAGVFIGASNGRSTSNHPSQSLTINTGNVTVTGVGQADIDLAGKAVATKNLTAVATKGSMHGSYFGTVEGGGNGSFTIKGGEAHIGIEASSGGNVNVAGALSATGPTAGVDIKGTSIKVSGGVTAIGSGGTDVIDLRPGLDHIRFTGPGDITGVNIGGVSSAASVNIGGTVKVKGPGLVGVLITGHKVTLGGLSASASAARKYTVLNTSDSPATDSFTLGDVAILVFQGSGGAVTGPATVNGNVNINAPHGDVFLGAQLNVKGQFAVNANGNVTTDVSAIAPRFNEISHGLGHGSSGSGIPSSVQLPFNLKAAGVSMVAGGSIDLTGATVTTPGVMALKAGTDIILSGVTLNTGTLAADAGSTIHNGGAVGTITTKALALVAGKNINLSSTQISVGSGVVTPVASNAALTAMFADPAFAAAVTGDPALLGGLAAAGISPAAPAPNAVFSAGNTLTLGSLNLTGTYLYLQAGDISLLGKVTVPKGTVVQFTPNGVTGTTDAEGSGAAGATLNLNDNGLFNLFPDGITLVLGGAGQGGAVALGNNGVFDIGSDNLIVDTTGTITGLGNVISTGQVVSLSSLLTVLPPVTAGEIDPTSNTNGPGTDKNKQGQDPNLGGAGTGNQPSIGQDTNPSSVCH